jgi:hypothetical protein
LYTVHFAPNPYSENQLVLNRLDEEIKKENKQTENKEITIYKLVRGVFVFSLVRKMTDSVADDIVSGLPVLGKSILFLFVFFAHYLVLRHVVFSWNLSTSSREQTTIIAQKKKRKSSFCHVCCFTWLSRRNVFRVHLHTLGNFLSYFFSITVISILTGVT